MLPVKKAHRIITILISFFTFLFIIGEVSAQRFTIPEDSDVLLRINNSRAEEALAPESIKFLVWNMYKGDKEAWAADFKKIIEDVDILMLQEVLTSPKMLEAFNEDSKRTYYLATSFFDKNLGNARSGVATASEYTPLKVAWQRSYYREPLVKTPKMTGLTTFELSGTTKNLLTVNIHAVNFVSARKLEHMIHEGLKVIGNHDGPAIFAGDFNTWSKPKLDIMMKLMGQYSMEEVKFSDDGRMQTFGNTLDHIFVRGLKIIDSKVYSQIEGSDHKAMYIEASVENL